MSQQLDTQGEAHDALGSAVNSYGHRVLSDPHILGNLVTDLLPDLPRERTLLVTGAEAGVAADITQYVEEQRIDPDTAVQLAARTLSERRAIDPVASMWVATEYAQALGYRVRPHAEAAQAPQPQVAPAAQPTVTALGGQPAPTVSLAQGPGTQEPQGQAARGPMGAQAPQGPPPQGPPGWQSWPPAQQGQSWPPAQPATGRPPSSGNSRKRGIAIGGAVAGLVVVFLIVAAAAGIAPFSKPSHTTPAAKPAHTSGSPKPAHSATASPSPTASLAAGVTPLIQLLPQDIADPTTQCTAIKKPDWTSPGLVSAVSCNDTDLPNGSVNAYQLDSRADYDTTWRNFNSWSSFDVSAAGSNCPPASSGAQGITQWNSQEGFPQIQGQVLECWMGSNSAPIYVWSLPSQDAFIIAVGADGSSFKALDTWWKSSNSAPANAPATPKPQSS
jgi:hypothetical protein